MPRGLGLDYLRRYHQKPLRRVVTVNTPLEAFRLERELSHFTARQTAVMMRDMTNRLRRATPKGSHWASVNWIPRIAIPDNTPAPPPRIGSELVDPAQVEAKRAEQKFWTDIMWATYRDIRQGNIYLNNNVPYINRLNRGHSKKAPLAFVERAITQAIRVGRRARVATRGEFLGVLQAARRTRARRRAGLL